MELIVKDLKVIDWKMRIRKILQIFHKYRLKELYVEIFEQKATGSFKTKPEFSTLKIRVSFFW